MDTIFALATARGKSGVAVIRLSGPNAADAIQQLCGNIPAPRRASLRKLRRSDGELLDEALILVFKQGQSFTGEDSAEIQFHGSPAVSKALLQELGLMHGLRLAEPGEFTRRALENGCLDLAQVEGLSDLIEAETEAQRRLAQRVFSGALGDKAERWRISLIRAAALLEATIDFADEEVPEDVRPEVLEIVNGLSKELKAEIDGSIVSERIRDGFEVAIVGPPNVGKSTLLNALAGREAAITSEFAGTTRDVIEVRMDLKGLPVTFLDTAGLRETSDTVEEIGIKRAIDRANQADLRVFLAMGEELVAGVEHRPGDIHVLGKADLQESAGFAISGKTGQGLDKLIEKIAETLEERASGAATAMRARHREAIKTAYFALKSARANVQGESYLAEIAAEELRSAIRALESLVGRVDVEHVLDEIFSKFCLGK